MQAYKPQQILIDQDSLDSPLTQRVLDCFPNIPYQVVERIDTIKQHSPLSDAKKNLVLTKYRGRFLKPCQGLGDYVCCNYWTMSLISNCHMECSYCFLQEYLHNNPAITMYTNIDDFLDSIDEQLAKNPSQVLRVGTGELSDSLALDHITGFAAQLVQFAAQRQNLILELKTKSNQVDNLIGLNHNKKTVVSWSINPQKFIDQEEHKTSSLAERLNAARQVANAGYPIGFHLDPLLALDGWQEEYKNLIQTLAQQFDSAEISWISLGSLRFQPQLQKIATQRFPKSRLFLNELIPSQDGKVRYFRDIREELYNHVYQLLKTHLSETPNYLCMETKKVWSNVVGDLPANKQIFEKGLTEKFAI